MSELITDQIFTDGQEDINASDMNGIIGKAKVQPDIIAAKVASATMDVADQMLILKTDNTLARARFDTIVNSTSSTLPVADTTKNGMLKQVSGNATDYVGGDNACHPVSSILPAGVVVSFAGPTVPGGWLLCDGTSKLRTDYPNLYAAIGTTYGSVDGTHFNVPNYQGRLTPGAGGSFGALGVTGGATSVTLAIGNLPNHSHSITDVQHGHTAFQTSHSHTYVWPAAGGTQWAASPGAWGQKSDNTGFAQPDITVNANFSGINTTQAVGSGTAFSILNPFITVYMMIKT